MTSVLQLNHMQTNIAAIVQGKPVAAYAEDQYNMTIVTQFRNDNERWNVRAVMGWCVLEDIEEFLFICFDNTLSPPMPIFLIGRRIS